MNTGKASHSLVAPAVSPSLYALLKDGKYTATKLGRAKWKGLIPNSSLQLNCNREGFNAIHCRIGITANQENDCNTPDSWLGFGTSNSGAGNFANGSWSPDNGGKDIKSFGYIFAR